jgi:hypothetical protein
MYNSPIDYAADNKRFNVTDPYTGEVRSCYVLAMQGNSGWCLKVDQADYVTRYMLNTYMVDPARVYVMGISAGAETTWECIGGPNASLYAGAIPLSTPSINSTIVDWKRLKAKVQAYHGIQDAGQTSYYNSQNLVKAVNVVKQGYASLYQYNGGHSGWGQFLDYNFSQPVSINGINKKLNNYELALAFTGGFIYGSSVVIPPIVSTAAKATFTVKISGNAVTCDPTGSVATQSYDWFTGDSTLKSYVKPELVSAALGGNNTNPIPITFTFKPGVYAIKLTCQDKAGFSSTFIQKVSVGTVVVIPPPVVVTKTIIGRLYIAGVEIVIYQDTNKVVTTQVNQ